MPCICSNIHQQYSHLLYQALSSVAAYLAIVRTQCVRQLPFEKLCSAPRQSVSASPLLAWLLSFVELGYSVQYKEQSWRHGISFITAVLLRCLRCVVVALSIYCLVDALISHRLSVELHAAGEP